MKILITGGKSALALKMLKAFEHHELLLADYGEMPNFASSTYKFISLGEKNEDTLAHNLLKYCLDYEVDLILPLHDFEIIALAKASVLFAEFNVEMVLPHANLNHYLTGIGNKKYKQWAVFFKGDTLFISLADQALITFAKSSAVSGAFYFNEADAVANLTLITI